MIFRFFFFFQTSKPKADHTRERFIEVCSMSPDIKKTKDHVISIVFDNNKATERYCPADRFITRV